MYAPCSVWDYDDLTDNEKIGFEDNADDAFVSKNKSNMGFLVECRGS